MDPSGTTKDTDNYCICWNYFIYIVNHNEYYYSLPSNFKGEDSVFESVLPKTPLELLELFGTIFIPVENQIIKSKKTKHQRFQRNIPT